MEQELQIDDLEKMLIRKPIGHSMKREKFSWLSLNAIQNWRRNRHLDALATTAIEAFDFQALFEMMDEGYTMNSKTQGLFDNKLQYIFKGMSSELVRASFSGVDHTHKFLHALEYGMEHGHFHLRAQDLYHLLAYKEIYSTLLENKPFIVRDYANKENYFLEFKTFGEEFSTALKNEKWATHFFHQWMKDSLKDRNVFYRFSHILTHYPEYLLKNVKKEDYLNYCHRLNKKDMYYGVSETLQTGLTFYDSLQFKESVSTENMNKHFSHLPEDVQTILLDIKDLYKQIQEQKKKHEHILTTDYVLIYKKALEQVITYNKIDDNMKNLKNVQNKTPNVLLMESLTEAQNALYEIVLGMNEEHVSKMSATNRFMKSV